MFLFKKIILLFSLVSTVCGDNENINCPRFCKCDSYLQLNRAQCSSKNLISAEVDLPQQVQILDLSYNDITTLDNKCFMNFQHVKYLNLSHNALHTISWNAFSRMRQLVEIDLSYNRLEYVDEGLFVKNIFLNKINLEGNKFETLKNKPLLNNPFVTELNLRNSQLNLLQPHLFKGLANLKLLDLSGNLLNNFNVEDFQDLKKLQHLNLAENFIRCDAVVKNKLQQLAEKGIQVAVRKCLGKAKAEKMFEKMIMAEQHSNEAENESLNKITQWRFNLEKEAPASFEEYYEDDFFTKSSRLPHELLRFAPDAVLCNKQVVVLCHEYRVCLTNLSEVGYKKRLCKEQCRSLNDVKFAFIMGLAIGISVIVIILACALCCKRCWDLKKPDASHNINTDELQNQNLASLSSQLPPQVCRPPRRRNARPPRSLARYEGPVAENFLLRLFGRPARRQYYRNINQNTATLIRRLSQSNLFSNRLSQHFIERQLYNSNSGGTQVVDASYALRAETPPPAYVETETKLSQSHS